MTTINVAIREKDFYAQLMAEIEARNVERAVEMVIGLPEIEQQLEVLTRLASDLVRARDSSLARDLGSALASVRDLARASDRVQVRVRVRALARASDHARVRAYALASVLTRDRDRVGIINKTIMGCLDILVNNYKSLLENPGWEIETPPAAPKAPTNQ